MPYEIRNDNVTRITYSGVLTRDDLLRLLQELEEIEQSSKVPGRLCDFRSVNRFDINFTDVMDFAKHRDGTKFANAYKSAIIANDNLQFGFARMYQTLNQNPQIVVKVFRDEASALEWLRNEYA